MLASATGGQRYMPEAWTPDRARLPASWPAPIEADIHADNSASAKLCWKACTFGWKPSGQRWSSWRKSRKLIYGLLRPDWNVERQPHDCQLIARCCRVHPRQIAVDRNPRTSPRPRFATVYPSNYLDGVQR